MALNAGSVATMEDKVAAEDDKKAVSEILVSLSVTVATWYQPRVSLVLSRPKTL